MEQELLTTRQAAELLGCTTVTIRQLAKRGELTSVWGPNPSPHGHRTILLYPIEPIHRLFKKLTPPENLLTHSQVADKLGIDHFTVFKWGNRGIIPYVEVPTLTKGKGSARMYPIDAIKKLTDELWGPIFVPDDWGHWFAGFIDGEGSFRMNLRKSGKLDTPNFKITLRDDDRQIIYGIKGILGIGQVRPNKGRDIHTNGKIYKGKPTLSFSITNLNDSFRLTTVLDRYPLRSKKRRDYALWREAVMEFRVPFKDRDMANLKDIAQRLSDVKKYTPSL